MAKIYFPGWYFPGFTIRKGALCWVTILTIDLIIPPWDIKFWSGFWVWREFLLFDTDWIVKPIADWLTGVQTFLAQKANYVRDEINKYTSGAIRVVSDWLNGVQTFLAQKANYVRDEINWYTTSAVKVVSDWINGVQTFLAQKANTVRDEIFNWVTAVGRDIMLKLNSIRDEISRSIIDFINRGFIGVVEMLIRSLDEMALDYYERHSEEEV